jgi:hypothetical protein
MYSVNVRPSFPSQPLSIVTASAGLVVTCLKLSGYIDGAISKLKLADASVRVIGIEIDSLSKVLDTIMDSFRNSAMAEAALQQEAGYQHWKNVKRSLKDCGATLKRLEEIFETLNQSDMAFCQGLGFSGTLDSLDDTT